MPTKIGRELALVSLPILIIGVVVWRKKSDDTPQDLWSGHARLLTRVRRLEVTPIDLYCGYTHKIAIDQWAAGQLPPVPLARAGAIRSYRQVVPRYGSLYVVFRQGKTWKRTLSIAESVEGNQDKSLKTPSVKPNIATLHMETVDSVGKDRGKFTSNYALRLPTSPRVEEAFLCGRTSANLEDRDVRMVGGVRNDTFVDQSDLFSEPIKTRLELQDESADTQTGDAARTLPPQPDWKVATMTVFPPGQMGANELRIEMALRSTSQASTSGRVRLIKPRLLGAKGRAVGHFVGYGSGEGISTPGTFNANVAFEVTAKQWKTLPRPLTFQTALSVDEGWPEEVNLVLGRSNGVLPAQPSTLRFVRDPLPLR